MYHIKNDKRSRRSAELIYTGLMRCLERKSFSEITITDVQKESYVGRATFYRLFDSLSDVLLYQCDRLFEQIFQKIRDNPEATMEARTMAFINGWIQHHKVIEAIVESNRIEILYESHIRTANELKEFLYRNSDMDEMHAEYNTIMLTTMLAGVFTIWVKRGKKETARELYEVLCDALLMFYESIAKWRN